MSVELDKRLRTAIKRFVKAWHDDTGQPLSKIAPAFSESLVKLEETLGAPLPTCVRVLLETLDGSSVPVSPERPDTVLSSSIIEMKLSMMERRDVVPIIECDLDATTGMQRVLGVAVNDPWGPMKQGDGETYDTDTVSLLDWFAQVIAENKTYFWPARRTITPGQVWSPRTEISEDELAAMPVGTAIATHYPQRKRHRMQLRLRALLEPGVWVESSCRGERDAHPFVELVARTCAIMERQIRRARSQWVLPISAISPIYRGVVTDIVREHFVGSVEIATG